MQKLFFILAWLLLSTGTVMMGVGSYLFVQYGSITTLAFSPSENSSIALAGQELPSSLGEVKGIETAVEVEDARPKIVENFLSRYKSPMTPHDYYGRKLVEIADKWEMDYRLLPAIAMQESNLCKKIPENSFNCLGFGIHSRGELHFESYEANFEAAAKTLKTKYIDQGRDTPEKIMQKYTPYSDGSWARSVKRWMHEMRYDDKVKGKEEAAGAISVHELLNTASNSATPSSTQQ
jgi:hypothetical protein